MKFRKGDFWGDLEYDIAYYSFGKLLVGLGSFLLIPILTRNLGVEEYGEYSLIIASSLFFMQFFTGWLKQAVLRYHSQYQSNGKEKAYLSTLKQSIVLVAILVIVATFIFVYISEDSVYIGVLVALVTSFWSIFSILVALNQSELKPNVVVVSDLIRTTSPVLLLVPFIIFEENLITKELAFGLLLISLIIAVLYQLNRLPLGTDLPQRKLVDKEIFSKLLKFGVPVGFWLALATSQMLLGRLVLDWYGFSVDLGVYSAYQDICMKASTLMFIPIIYAVHPRIMESWNQKDRHKVKLNFRKSLIYIMIFICLFISGSFLLFDVIINILFSSDEIIQLNIDKYGVLLFILFALAEGLNQLSLISHKGYELSDKTKLMALTMLGCLLINVLLVFIFTEPYGIFGVILSLIITRVIYIFITWAYSFKIINTEKF